MRPTILVSVFALVLGFAGAVMAAEKRPIIIDLQAVGYEQPQDYFVTLLEMALEESKAPDEDIRLRFSERDYSQARWIYLAQHDTGNLVIWTMTSKEREERLLPIRIPIFKGLFGKRVFIIRKEDQALFDQVRTPTDLAKFTAGQGMHWPDVEILEANGLPVTTAATVDSLYKMLKAKRFDYFPRGVSEAWFELAQSDKKDLVVEKNLMLVYPAAVYYFVNKENVDLARRIETGLEMLIAKGSFDEFFHSHRRTQTGLEEVTRHPRRMIYLENPNSPTQQPLEKYWLNLPSRND